MISVGPEVDELVWVIAPDPFYAVGLWYSDFSQTTDEEVRELLESAAREHLEHEHASAGVAARP